MKNSLYLISFVFTCLVSCGLYANDGNPDPCLIKGQVLDAVTKKPVSGVVVSAMVPGDPILKKRLPMWMVIIFSRNFPPAMSTCDLKKRVIRNTNTRK